MINAGNELYEEITLLINFLIENKQQLIVLLLLLQLLIFLGKEIKNKTLLNNSILDLFSKLVFTTENDLIMEKVKDSNFRDLEDALQYYSAIDSKMEIIITKNYFDFENSAIPVYHPL